MKASLPVVTVRYKPIEIDLWPFTTADIAPIAALVAIYVAFVAGFFCGRS